MIHELRTDQQQRWTQGDRVSIDTYVRRHPELVRDAEQLSDLILSEILLREAAGEHPKIDEYLRQYPHCAPRLLQRYRADLSTAMSDVPPTLNISPSPFMETIALDEQGQVDAQEKAFQAGLPNIPGYQIVSELGRGGMGVVYRAKQLSADRDVALKIVRNDVLDTLPLATRTSTLERFRHEAHAAAKLQHDNLVAVYDVGDAGGLRYYAMRFVDGVSLYDMLRERPLDNIRAAKYIEPIARGLHFAHEQGVLHRDLKPHNIIIEQATDRPLLTDFGLAKFLERRDELTHDGAVMGTPSYMSPEQARDSGKVTALADVYSLGATLYHVLTSRPPFQAANVGETIRQVLDDEPLAPRTLNPAIDRDLETICLRCLQKDPARRYESSAALADDLQRFLKHEPILARPIGWVERAWRWRRRNPKVARAVALATFFGIAALVSMTLGYLSTSAALVKESEARAKENAAKKHAMLVVDELFTQISEDDLLNQPGMQQLRKQLLAKALKHYQFFLEESDNDPTVRDAVATAHFRVGLIAHEMGNYESARRELEKAAQQQQQLFDESPDDPTRLDALGDTLNFLGRALAQRDQRAEAAQAYSRAEILRQRLVDVDAKNREWQRKLANLHMHLGLLELATGEPQQQKLGRAHIRQAQQRRQVILENDPNYKLARRDLAMGYYNLAENDALAFYRLEEPRPAEQALPAINHLRDAIKHFEALDKNELANRYRLGVSYCTLGGLLADVNRANEAEQAYQSAHDLITSLAVGNPDVTEYQIELSRLAMNQGALYDRLHDLATKAELPTDQALLVEHRQQTEAQLKKAIAAWSHARDLLQQLLKTDPHNPDFRRDLASALDGLAEDYHLQSNIDQEISLREEVVRELRQITKQLPDDKRLVDWLTEAETDLADARTRRAATEPSP